MNRKHRAMGVPNHRLGDAAERYPPNPSTTVTSEDDEFGLLALCKPQDSVIGMRLRSDERLAVRGESSQLVLQELPSRLNDLVDGGLIGLRRNWPQDSETRPERSRHFHVVVHREREAERRRVLGCLGHAKQSRIREVGRSKETPRALVTPGNENGTMSPAHHTQRNLSQEESLQPRVAAIPEDYHSGVQRLGLGHDRRIRDVREVNYRLDLLGVKIGVFFSQGKQAPRHLFPGTDLVQSI